MVEKIESEMTRNNDTNSARGMKTKSMKDIGINEVTLMRIYESILLLVPKATSVRSLIFVLVVFLQFVVCETTFSAVEPKHKLASAKKSLKIGAELTKTDPAQAVEHFKAALRLDPKLSDAYFGLGLAYRELKQFAEAEKAVRSGLVVKPTSDVGLATLGQVLISAGRLKEAVKETSSCDRKKLVHCMEVHARALFLTDSHERAFEIYSKLVVVDPKLSRYHAGRFDSAMLSKTKGFTEQALRDWDRHLPDDPALDKRLKIIEKMMEEDAKKTNSNH